MSEFCANMGCMNESEKELLENILTADILILAESMRIRNQMNGLHGDFVSDAIREIKAQRRALIERLISTT